MSAPLEKPTYGTTKSALNWSLILGWLVLIALTGGALWGQKLAVEMAWIMAPSMVALIVAILGVHRAFGSMDMRTMAMARPPRLPSRSRSSNRARADPDDASGGEASP